MQPREKEKGKTESPHSSSSSSNSDHTTHRPSPKSPTKEAHDAYEKESDKSIQKIRLTAQLFGNQDHAGEMNHSKFMTLRNRFYTQYRFLLLLNKIANENISNSSKIETLLTGLNLLEEEGQQADILSNKDNSSILKNSYRHSICSAQDVKTIRTKLVALFCSNIDIYINDTFLSKGEMLSLAAQSKKAYVFIKNSIINGNKTRIPSLFYITNNKVIELPLTNNNMTGLDNESIWMSLHDMTSDIDKNKKVNPKSSKIENIWNIITHIDGHSYAQLGMEYIEFSRNIKEEIEKFTHLYEALEKHSAFYADNHAKFSTAADSLQLYIYRPTALPLTIKNLEDRKQKLRESIEQEIVDKKHQTEETPRILEELKKKEKNAQEKNDLDAVEKIKKLINEETIKYNKAISRLKTITTEGSLNEEYLNEQVAIEKKYHHDKSGLLKTSLSSSGVKTKVKLKDLEKLNNFPYEQYHIDNNSLFTLMIKPEYHTEFQLISKVALSQGDQFDHINTSAKSHSCDTLPSSKQKKLNASSPTLTSAISPRITSVSGGNTSYQGTSSTSSTPVSSTNSSGTQRINITSRARAMATTSIKPLPLAASSSPKLQKREVAKNVNNVEKDRDDFSTPDLVQEASLFPPLTILKEVEKEKSSEDKSTSDTNSPKSQESSSEPSSAERTDSSEEKVTVQYRKRLNSNPAERRRNSANTEKQAEEKSISRPRRNSLPISFNNGQSSIDDKKTNENNQQLSRSHSFAKNAPNRALRRSHRFNQKSLAGYNLYAQTNNHVENIVENPTKTSSSPRLSTTTLFNTAPTNSAAIIIRAKQNNSIASAHHHHQSEPKRKRSHEGVSIEDTKNLTHSAVSLPASPELSLALQNNEDTKAAGNVSPSITSVSMHNSHTSRPRRSLHRADAVTANRRKPHTDSESPSQSHAKGEQIQQESTTTQHKKQS